jgi:serine/threonine protein kinase
VTVFHDDQNCVDEAVCTVVETLVRYGFDFSMTSSSFDVKCLLGAGSTSYVYGAVRRCDGFPVTLKVLNPRSMLGKYQALASFAIEIIVGKCAKSKSMIAHTSYGCVGDTLFIVRESADKVTPEFTDELSPAELGVHFSQYCASILNLHEQGFSAIDVVPSNFLRCDRGVVIGDIGSTRITRDDACGSEIIHEVISKVSSKWKCKLHHSEKISELAMAQDIAGLGLIFYEIITGQKVAGAENFPFLLDRHLRIDRPSVVNRQATDVFDDIVHQMLGQLTSPNPALLSDFAAQLRSR